MPGDDPHGGDFADSEHLPIAQAHLAVPHLAVPSAGLEAVANSAGMAGRRASQQDWREPSGGHFGARYESIYGALDLGTNNCRLLLARPSRRGFRVVDSFSRIIRLGEGVTQSGRLSEPAMQRTFDALRICANKISRHGVIRSRLVATEACRIAVNGEDFLREVKARLGLDIEILSREDEAQLAVSGCASLIDTNVDYVLVFDIGGGSSELIWLELPRNKGGARTDHVNTREKSVIAWTSLPVGVVTLAERFDGRVVTPDSFEAMVSTVADMLRPFEATHDFKTRLAGQSLHLLGTSGTVTTIAGIMLGLPRYDRKAVDGCWLATKDVQNVTSMLLGYSYEQRIAQPCIGRERADLVLAGCAILEAVLRQWPSERLRVADRGLREGILMTMMTQDGVLRGGRRRRPGGHSGQHSNSGPTHARQAGATARREPGTSE